MVDPGLASDMPVNLMLRRGFEPRSLPREATPLHTNTTPMSRHLVCYIA